MNEINGVWDSNGITSLAQTLRYTGSLQVIFAKHIYAVTLSFQAKHNMVQRATRENAAGPLSEASFSVICWCSSKTNKTYITAVVYTICTKRMKGSSYYSSLKVQHLLKSCLAEGFCFPYCFAKVEWISPTTERRVTTRTTDNTNRHRKGAQCA